MFDLNENITESEPECGVLSFEGWDLPGSPVDQ